MSELLHPLPNLVALKTKLGVGLAHELLDALNDAATLDDVTEILTTCLRTRVAEIEEEIGAAS